MVSWDAYPASIGAATMILTYEAIDNAGHSLSDSIEARDPRDAVDRLRRRGLYVTEIREASRLDRVIESRPSASGAGRLPLKTLTLFTRQLAMLLRSGSDLVPAIQALKRQMTNPRHAALLRALATDVEDGSTLTEAMRQHPATFDCVYCAIVAAGEASGTLTEMFERLSVIVGKRRAMQKKILGSLAYPALLVSMSFHIILVLLFFVLPRFNAMFEQLAVETPASTKMLLTIGDTLRQHWSALLAGVVGVVVAATVWLRSPGGRQWLSDVQLSIPLLGRVRARLIQGQLFRTMGMLLESRVGVIETLELVRESTRNRKFRKLFDRLDESVTSGGELGGAFAQSGLVDPFVCQAIHTGEQSGNIGEAISFCADTLDEDNEELINAVTKLIEPIILIGMGLVVGAVAISLFVPLFDMTSAMR